jgi:hypothetical protein
MAILHADPTHAGPPVAYTLLVDGLPWASAARDGMRGLA